MSLTPHKQPVASETWTVVTAPLGEPIKVDVHLYGPPPLRCQAVLGDRKSVYQDDAIAAIMSLMLECKIGVEEIVAPGVTTRAEYVRGIRSETRVSEKASVAVPARRCIILFEAPSCIHWSAWRGQSSWRAGCKEIQMEVEGATFADLQVAANLSLQHYFRERMKSKDPSFSWRDLGLYPIGGPLFQDGTETWDQAEFDIPFTMTPVT